MTEDYRPVEDPIETAGPPPPPRTRSVRRPAAGGTKRPSERAKKRKTSAKPTGPSPEEGIRGLIQIPAAITIMAGQKANSVALVADGATLLYHGPALAEATVQLAEYDPRIMALLEKAIAFGPYGLFLSVVFAIGVQGARNHELANSGLLEGFGAMPPQEIISKAGMDFQVNVSPNGQASDGAPATD